MRARPARFAALGEHAFRALRPANAPANALHDALARVPGVREVVLTERYVVAHLDESARALPGRAALERALARAVTTGALKTARALDPARTHSVLVRYDGEDLDCAAASAGLSREALVELHASGVYEVRFVGFAPGFAYLGPVDPRLALARRATPRARVPAGSVAIAGGYTAVYPRAGAGGWHLLGTALGFEPFDPRTGSALRTGDLVRFVPDVTHAPRERA